MKFEYSNTTISSIIIATTTKIARIVQTTTEIPLIIKKIASDNSFGTGLKILISFGITMAIISMCFCWVWIFYCFKKYRQGVSSNYYDLLSYLILMSFF